MSLGLMGRPRAPARGPDARGCRAWLREATPSQSHEEMLFWQSFGYRCGTTSSLHGVGGGTGGGGASPWRSRRKEEAGVLVSCVLPRGMWDHCPQRGCLSACTQTHPYLPGENTVAATEQPAVGPLAARAPLAQHAPIPKLVGGQTCH